MKIYTRTGDDGSTSLFGGKRLPKYALRIESYGTVDELNASIGLLMTAVAHSEVSGFLQTIQSRLFDIGSHLAAEPGKNFNLPQVDEARVDELEHEMDKFNAELPELRHFVLPGGSTANAYAHQCRTICRRAERRVVALAEEEEVSAVIIKYLNRLSDYFFVLSRWLSVQAGAEEIKWIPSVEE